MLGFLYFLIFVASREQPKRELAFKWLGPVGLPFVALLGISVVSLLNSAEHFLGISNVLVQLQVYLVYLLALNCVRSEEDLMLTLKVLYTVLAVQCAVYFFEVAFQIPYVSLTDGIMWAPGPDPVRPGGTLGTNPFSFTDFTLPILFILFANIVSMRAPGAKTGWKSVLLLAIGMTAIGLSLTRTAYANLFLGLLCVVALGHMRRSVSTRKAASMLAIGLLVAILVAPMIIKRIERESMHSSYDERAALMEMAINVVRAHPVLGVGPGAYETSYKRYLTANLEDKWQWMVHNYYLLRTAENGLFGGLALIVFLLMALRSSSLLSARSHPTVQPLALATAAMVITTAHEMYWDQWTHVPSQMLFLFILGLAGAARSIDLPDRQARLAPDISSLAGAPGGSSSSKLHISATA